jgi:hypothetical protein
MASSSDPWVREYSEASRLADDVTSMIADRGSLPQSGPEIMRHTSAIRRKITILGTRLDSLEALLSRIPPKSMYTTLLLIFCLCTNMGCSYDGLMVLESQLLACINVKECLWSWFNLRRNRIRLELLLFAH